LILRENFGQIVSEWDTSKNLPHARRKKYQVLDILLYKVKCCNKQGYI
jgi:hypothetical protein